MKNLRYLFLVCLTWMILGSCGEEYVYNTRVVTGVDLLDVGEEGNLLFSRGENGEIKVRITPVDAIDKKDYTFRIRVATRAYLRSMIREEYAHLLWEKPL